MNVAISALVSGSLLVFVLALVGVIERHIDQPSVSAEPPPTAVADAPVPTVELPEVTIHGDAGVAPNPEAVDE